MALPTFSIVIPTLNAARTLPACLDAISVQDYPRQKVRLIVADAGSRDDTLSIAKKHGAQIVPNALRTGEAGKAAGLRRAKGDLVAFVDSDNILLDPKWLSKMAAPFAERTVLCAEPDAYAHRKSDNYITRYCALMGLNDPLVYFIGNYDRYNYLDRAWTRARVETENKKGYVKVKAICRPFPTVGANGFVARRSALKPFLKDDYFFDVDVGAQLLARPGAHFAKVDAPLVHLYSGSFATFVRKQRRRVSDFLYHRARERKGSSSAHLPVGAVALFALSTVLVVPLLAQALLGYSRKPDRAWFFHVPASIATLLVYAHGVVSAALLGARAASRERWSQ